MGSSPPPLEGEGQGGGQRQVPELECSPLPNPPPKRRGIAYGFATSIALEGKADLKIIPESWRGVGWASSRRCFGGCRTRGRAMRDTSCWRCCSSRWRQRCAGRSRARIWRTSGNRRKGCCGFSCAWSTAFRATTPSAGFSVCSSRRPSNARSAAYGGLCQSQRAQSHRCGGGRRQSLAWRLRTRRASYTAATGQRLCSGCANGFGSAEGCRPQRDGGSVGGAGASVPRRLHCYRRCTALPPRLCRSGAQAGRRLCSGHQSQPRPPVHGGYATVWAIGQAQHRRRKSIARPRPKRDATLRPSCAIPRSLASTTFLASLQSAASPLADDGAASTPISRLFATISCPNTSPPRDCCTSPAVTGPSRTNSIGYSTSILPRMAIAPERTTPPKTSPFCEGSLSTSCELIQSPASLRRKIKRAGWNDAFLMAGLSHMR